MPPRKVPPDEVLKEMYSRPMSSVEIAKQLGLKVSTVQSALYRIPGFIFRTGSEAVKLSYHNGRKATRYWLGKKQSVQMIEKRIAPIRGAKHWLWKGGKERRPYRKSVAKEKCARCGSKLNLCIHHLDFDHYNDNPLNLLVLCLHCHLSLHKTEYWQAHREKRLPRQSTAPCHWEKT
jgi:hypothetical protein